MDDAPDREWIDAGPEAEFEPGAGRRVEAGATALAVFRDPAGGYTAFADRCPHAGAPLSAGLMRDGTIVCSWHGWTFESATGRCRNVPWAQAATVHDVRIEDGRVLVDPEPRPPSEDQEPQEAEGD